MAAKKKYLFAVAAVFLLLFACWIWWGNTALEISGYTISSEKIPQSFSGFRIAQVSDLHNAEFGEGNTKLISMLAQTAPDIIVITGDLIDSRHTDIEIALQFSAAATEIAPVFYITGNHEARVAEYDALKNGLLDAGVMVLENEKVVLPREGEQITLLGIHDPSFVEDYLFGDAAAVTAAALGELLREEDGYTILLVHRPELFGSYVESEVDLVFSGHAHGGQFRLPFVGGLIAPNQGLFPKYDAGLFTEASTTMIVSRGVGNSILPVRFNNRPEIVVVELETRNG